ncbi:hypothetical protein Hanom_Chr17g01540631 [Helianthus anomalus]
MFYPFENIEIASKMMFKCWINIPDFSPLSTISPGDNHFLLAVHIIFLLSNSGINCLSDQLRRFIFLLGLTHINLVFWQMTVIA